MFPAYRADLLFFLWLYFYFTSFNTPNRTRFGNLFVVSMLAVAGNSGFRGLDNDFWSTRERKFSGISISGFFHTLHFLGMPETKRNVRKIILTLVKTTKVKSDSG